MRKRRFFVILLVLAVFVSSLSMQAFAAGLEMRETPYVVTVYNERNGLPTGEANAVVQTADGYIWIGSYGGLIRYDGTSFYNYSTEGILPTSSVRALYEDSTGRLWVGTNDSGVFYLEHGELFAVENPDPKSYLCVRGFAEGADGVIYVASNSGMGEVRDGTLIAYDDDRISGHTVYSLGVDNYGRVWGAMDSGLCAVVKDGQALRIFSSDEFFDDVEIYCSAANKNGCVYLGTSGSQMALLTFPSESLERKDMEVKYLETPHVTTHNSIVTTDSGVVIVCGNVGACVIDSENIERGISSENGASAVNSGCVDYEGNVWLASTSSGIIKYTRGYFNSPNKEAGLTDVAINAIVRAQGCSYLGTNTGLLIFDGEWQPVNNALTELLDGARIRSLLVDSKGRVWVASYVNQAPVICFDPTGGTMEVFTVDEGLVNSSARSLLELSDGSVAVGTQGGLSIIRNSQVVKNYTPEDGITVGSILCILEGHDGTLLLGSDGGGIYEIDGGAIVNYSDESGLNDGVVLRMLRDEGRSGYFVSAGSSLYYWDDNGFRKLPIQKGAGSIFDFFIRDGMVWILQNGGILTFDREKLLAGEDPMPQQFSFAHGLTGSIDANTWSWQDKDGSLYLPTRSGVSVFGFDPVLGTLPKGIISGVHTDSAFYSYPESVEVEKHTNRVTIDFAVLSFTETYDVGVTYILEGFDETETTVVGEKSGNISYTNLPGGEYTFRLRIFLLDHPELFNDYTLTVVKEPKLLELMPVRVLLISLLVLFVALVVALVYRAKIRGIRKRQQDYHSLIEQMLRAYARTIDEENAHAKGHSLRVAEYARELARRMTMSKEEQEDIYCVALVHDTSRIDVPNDIPVVTHIITVADAYDMMSQVSGDREALAPDVIAEELKKGSGTQFDPEVVPHMLAMIAEGAVPVKPKN